MVIAHVHMLILISPAPKLINSLPSWPPAPNPLSFYVGTLIAKVTIIF